MRVIRFKHPDIEDWYSYAMLMERAGTTSDNSGWLVFLEVGGDYAGQGGLEYYHTESMLKQLKKWVEVSEFEINLSSFWKFYRDKINRAVKNPLGSVSDTELMRFRLNEFERLSPHIRGRLLEFITKSFYEVYPQVPLHEDYPEVHLRFKDPSVMRDNKEIDVLAIRRNARELVVAECKTSIPVEQLDDLIGRINFKTECVRRSSHFRNFECIRKVFVTTLKGVADLRSFDAVIQRLREASIELLVLEQDILPRLPHRFKQEELQGIFQLDHFEDLEE